MSVTAERTSDLAHVEATLNYLAPMTERPRNYTFDPPPGVPRSNSMHEAHTVAVHDARAVEADISLDREGFALLRYQSAVKDFWDEDEVRRVYYPEVAAASSPRRPAPARCSSSIIPSGVGSAALTTGQPARRVSPRPACTWTIRRSPARSGCAISSATRRRNCCSGRVQVINLWRPIRGPLRDAPLAVCDAGSVAPGDLVSSDLVYQNRVGETYGVTYNPAHRWFYVPDMQPDEALLLKCFELRDRWTRPLRSAYRVRGPDGAGGCAAPREHRDQDPGVPPGLTEADAPGNVTPAKAGVQGFAACTRGCHRSPET